MHGRIVEVRVYRIDLSHLDQQASFFVKLPPGRLAYVLIVLDIATGNTPGTPVHPSRPASQDKTLPVRDNDGDADHRVLPEDKPTGRAHLTPVAVQLLVDKGRGAVWTVPVLAWHQGCILLCGMIG